MYRTYENSTKMLGASAAILRWVLGLILGTVAMSAWAQPANDNFANATVIKAAQRTVYGSNVGATREIGEPFHAGDPGGASVWWSWVAGFTGSVSFDTEGSSFDTVMAVYTGTNVAYLTSVAANDDVNFPADLTSKVTFAVTAGTTYYIAVDGFGGASGQITLNWMPVGSASAGSFLFASAVTRLGSSNPLYVITEHENDADIDPAMIASGIRVVVGRTGGTAGRVLVKYTFTNDLYTNIFISNYFGTNYYLTNTDSSTTPPTVTFSNFYFTNIVVKSETNFYYNGYQYVLSTNTDSYSQLITNATPGPVIYTNLSTNTPALPQSCAYNSGLPGVTSTNGTISSVLVTESFCFVTNAQQIVPSALDGVDYNSGPYTADFYDYQMDQEILTLGVIPSAPLNGTTPFGAIAYPRLVKISIDSVSLQPGESTNIAPPTLDQNKSTCYINILPISSQAKITANLEAGVQRVHENNTTVAHVYVTRSGVDPTASGTINYQVIFKNGNPDRLNSFNLQPGSDYATPSNPVPLSSQPADFDSGTAGISGTLTWGGNDYNPKTITIPLFDDSLSEFNEDIFVVIFDLPGATPPVVGYSRTSTLTITDDDSPAGAADNHYNRDNDATTDPPYNPLPGANNSVYAVAVQPDGKMVFGGEFTGYNTRPRNHIARANLDGQIDEDFLPFPNSGFNGVVNCLSLQPDGKIIAGGQFSSFNGTNRFSIARLNNSGSLDLSFNPGLGVLGTVWWVGAQTDGKVVLAGNFNQVGGTNRNYIARLNADGSVDPSFDPGTGPNGTIHAVAIQTDGKILIAGEFTAVGNTNRAFVARLLPSGSLDSTFDPGTGANGIIYALGLQADGRILLGGAFTSYNLANNNHLVRVNSDGSLDSSFDIGSGFDATVYSIVLQPDQRILVGGIFEAYNSTRRMGLARILSTGFLDTSFLDTAYNHFAGLTRQFASEDIEPRHFVSTIALQGDGSVMIGGSFNILGGAPGLYNGVEMSGRTKLAYRGNVARLTGGSTPGPGNLGFLYSNYSADENGGSSYVSLVRTNGSLGAATASFSTTAGSSGLGVAVEGTDYTFDANAYGLPTWPNATWPGSSWMYTDSIFGPNFVGTDNVGNKKPNFGADVFIKIIDDKSADGNKSLGMQVGLPPSGNIMLLGGDPVPFGVGLGHTRAPLTIVNNYSAAGTLGFSSASFTANENGTNAVITVTRTNGASGLVTVNYATANGTNNPPFTIGAVAGTTNDYLATSGQLTFNNGETNKTFLIPLVNNTVAQSNRTVNLSLSSFSGGSKPGLSNAVLTIIDDDYSFGRINFTATNYNVHETAGSVTVTATRTGGNAGSVSVTYATANATAVNGADYLGVTNTLTWINGDTAPKTFTIPVYDDGLVLTTPKTFKLLLYNGIVNTLPQRGALGTVTNATVSIQNDDAYGQPSLSLANYFVNENGGPAQITVVRQGGSAQTITVDYRTADFTATAAAGDYIPVTGTLTFNPGVFSQSFTIPINDDLLQQGNRSLLVYLTNATPSAGPGGGVTLGSIASGTVTIVDNESFNEPPGGLDTTFYSGAYFNDTVYALTLQQDGKILAGGDFTIANATVRNRIARLNADGTLDIKFSSISEGVDGSVRSIVAQTDKRILLAGNFSQINSVNRAGIGRLNIDGSLDTSFNPGSGADSPVYAVAETFSGTGTNALRKVLVGGAFTTLNGYPHHNVGQFNDDGTVDSSFLPLGANGTVYALAVYSTNDVNHGKILIGGEFTLVNGITRNHIARLNSDGSLDTTFDPGVGPSDTVRALAIQLDGKVIIGGTFTKVGNTTLNHLARLNSDGTIDTNFAIGLGANDVVTCVALQEDLKILVGGGFTRASGVTRNRLTRLNSDGTLDPTINFGLGADNFISAILVQPDSRMLIGGAFTSYDGASSLRIARVYGRTVTDVGQATFTSANYSIDEHGTNVVLTVRRTGGTAGTATVVAATSDGTALAGQDYQAVTVTNVFPAGETFQTFLVPIIPNLSIGPNLNFNVTLQNPNPSGILDGTGNPALDVNFVLGNQPAAVVTILNDNSTVSFSSDNYRVIKNVTSGTATIRVERNGSTIGNASVDFITTNTGDAVPGIDYTPVTNSVVFLPGQPEVVISLPIINNGLLEGDRTVGMALVNPSNTVPTLPSTATLTIVDNNLSPGNIKFAKSSYTVNENPSTLPGATNSIAAITLLRTNGLSGQVSVQVSMGGGTAVPGVDYILTNQTLIFADGQATATFFVTIPHNPLVTGDQTVNISLANATGGALILGATTETLTIVDQDVGFGFSQSSYFVSETAGSLTLNVLRIGRTNGSCSVHFATLDGTAVAGTAYSSVSNLLTFAAGETFKAITVPIIHNPLVTGNQSFVINLFNPSAGAQLGAAGSALVTVLDVDTGLALATNQLSIAKSGGQLAIGVVRTGSPAGTVGVAYATSDGTAISGVNYTATSGVLTFLDGQTSNYFVVPILNDHQVDGDLTFNLSLSSPTNGAQLLLPSSATVTIVDITSGFNFASSAFTVNENGVNALITVLRNGVTNTAVSVNYATTEGSAHAGVDYVATSGTLQFLPGQISRTFPVTIIDRGLIGGTVTALINLANPSTNCILLATNIATLNINDNDGSLIVPAGVSLIAESGPTNGVIDPGETCTVLFALRDGAGNNTSNLVATLLSTNGVSAPSAPQPYGVLQAFGPSVSRPFSFKANGTNGGSITAVFSLQDGTNNLGSSQFVYFSFALGANTNSFGNSSTIVINDLAPASPYPSVINVSGLNGLVSKVSVTVSNLSHGYLSDVDMLLVGPAGQKQLLMTHVGGGHGATNLTLTFDDAATNSLTTATPTSGTYKPTQFGIVPFPAPAPAQPYALNLAAFNGSNPNGVWSLYVLDDNALDGGGITNGWSLKIQTVSPVPGSVDLVLGASSTPAQVVATSNLVFTLSVTNAGPAAATGLILSNTLPAGSVYVSSVPNNPTLFNVGGHTVVVFNLGNMGANASTNIFITASAPAAVGSITNSASLAGNESDPNLANNVASVVSSVIAANADLAIGLVGAPDPVFAGGNLTYTLSVTNLGPASSTNAIITDILPPGMSFVSASAGGTYATNTGIVTFNLGGLGSGAVVIPTIIVRASGIGTVTNTVNLTSGVADPFKGNNRASVKTIVQAVPISTSTSGQSVVFTWPASASGYVIEFTPTLVAPLTWTIVTNPVPVVVSGQNTFTPNLPGYYRLRAPLP